MLNNTMRALPLLWLVGLLALTVTACDDNTYSGTPPSEPSDDAGTDTDPEDAPPDTAEDIMPPVTGGAGSCELTITTEPSRGPFPHREVITLDDEGRVASHLVELNDTPPTTTRHDYTFDDQGRLLTHGEKTYTWRADGRLNTKAIGDNFIARYEYDDVTNTITEHQGARQVYVTAPDTGAIIRHASFSDAEGQGTPRNTVYDYDQVGRLLKITTDERFPEDPPQVNTHNYDDQGRLERVDFARGDDPPTGQELYVYDDEGQLIERSDTTSVDTYTWEDGEVVGRRWAPGHGELVVFYEYGSSRPGACAEALIKQIHLAPARHYDGITRCLLFGRNKEACTRGVVLSPLNEMIQAGTDTLP